MKKTILLFFLACFAIGAYSQVGIGTTSPNSTLDVRGSLSVNTSTFTSSVAVSSTDHIMIFTGTTAATATLPTAVGCTGRIYYFKNASTTVPTPVLTVATSSSQTIDASASITVDDANEIVCVVSDGTNWRIVNMVLPNANASTSWSQGGNGVSALRNFGTTNNYDVPFITNNIERMRLNTSGNLGIGTSSQTEKLQVEGNIRLSGSNRSIFFDATSDPYAGIKNVTRTPETNELLLFSGNDFSTSYGPDRIRLATHEIHLATANSNPATNSGDATSNFENTTTYPTRLYINPAGNVAIGTTTFDDTYPEKLLVDAGTTNSVNAIVAQGTINNYFQLNVQNLSNGNWASSDIVATANNGNESTVYIDMGINSQGYSTGSSSILNGSNTAYIYATGNHFFIGNGAQNKDLVFFTNSGGTGADGQERMRITTSAITTNLPFQPANDNSYTLGAVGKRWSVVYAANGTIQTSDARLKTNIHSLNYGLKEVMAMKPVQYNWKDNSSASPKIGFIAQEIKELVPEVVSGDEAIENLGMNYAELIPVLVNAIKEQQQQIDQLKKEIQQLKKK
jgi:hypothetical protein